MTTMTKPTTMAVMLLTHNASMAEHMKAAGAKDQDAAALVEEDFATFSQLLEIESSLLFQTVANCGIKARSAALIVAYCERMRNSHSNNARLDIDNLPVVARRSLLVEHKRDARRIAEKAGSSQFVFEILDPTADAMAPENLGNVLIGRASTHLGNLLKDHKNDIEGAEAEYCRAIEADPSNADAHIIIGNLLIDHKKDAEGGEAHFRRAIKIDPNSADAHVSLGKVLLHHKKDVESAEAEFRCAIEIDPNNPETRMHLGMLLVTMKKETF